MLEPLGAEGLVGGAHPVVGGRGYGPGSWSWGQNPSISRAPVLWAHTPSSEGGVHRLEVRLWAISLPRV